MLSQEALIREMIRAMAPFVRLKMSLPPHQDLDWDEVIKHMPDQEDWERLCSAYEKARKELPPKKGLVFLGS